jgi:hypothetical protein
MVIIAYYNRYLRRIEPVVCFGEVIMYSRELITLECSLSFWDLSRTLHASNNGHGLATPILPQLCMQTPQPTEASGIVSGHVAASLVSWYCYPY